MTVLIVEDEQLAQERLQAILRKCDPSINIVACLESVVETVKWLQTKTHPDLILLDIHLADGDSFEIFKRTSTQKPVIFTTAYEDYALEAFKLFSIDYILKPVTSVSLAAALNKYRNLSSAFTPHNYEAVMEKVKENYLHFYKDRFLAKVGKRLFSIEANEVAFFSADNKVVSVTNKEGNRFIINTTLESLEKEIDPKLFFRINRSIIVGITALQQVKPFVNNRLKLYLKNINTPLDLVISRERVAAFKDWAGGY